MKIPLFAAAVFALLGSASITCAQPPAPVSLQFVSFPKVEDAQPLELLIGDGITLKVELPTNNLSPVYKVAPMSKWILGKTITGPDGKPSFKIHGEAHALGSPNQLILVVRNEAVDTDKLTLTPFEGGSSGFGGGSYLFFNATKVDIAADVGETKIALKPSAHRLVHPKPSQVKGDRKYLYIYMYFRKGQEAVPFYSSTWRFSEKARSMVFFHHEPTSGRLRTHSIRDYIP